MPKIFKPTKRWHRVTCRDCGGNACDKCAQQGFFWMLPDGTTKTAPGGTFLAKRDPELYQFGYSQRLLWLEDRRSAITATDAAAIVGLSAYASPLSVWMDKMGYTPEEEPSERMEWGLRLEDAICQAVADRTGRRFERASFIRHPEHAWAAATPDFYDVDDGSILEVKTAGHWSGKNWGDPGSDEVPSAYVAQVTWQMMVRQVQRARLAVLIGGNELRLFQVAYDKELAQGMARPCKRFWDEHVLARVEPPASAVDQELLQNRYTPEPQKVIQADEAIDEIVGNLQTVADEAFKAQELLDESKNRLRQYMGDASILNTSYGTVTWKADSRGVRSLRLPVKSRRA